MKVNASGPITTSPVFIHLCLSQSCRHDSHLLNWTGTIVVLRIDIALNNGEYQQHVRLTLFFAPMTVLLTGSRSGRGIR